MKATRAKRKVLAQSRDAQEAAQLWQEVQSIFAAVSTRDSDLINVELRELVKVLAQNEQCLASVVSLLLQFFKKLMLGEDLEGYSIVTEPGLDSDRHILLGESLSATTPYERVVIKFLSATHSYIQQQSILQEMESLRQLHHPHILPILSVGVDKNRPYLITEYIASGSLHTRLQSACPGQPMPWEEASSLLTQIGEALYYAHQQHVIHGNLKPQNVLITMVDNVLLTGFHLHTLASSDESGDAHLADAIYLAPEQLAGHSSEKSDQYALGCLAYEMLTGSKAFMVPSVNTPGKYYRTKSPVMPGKVNPALPLYIERAILKAMSRDPDQRYHDVSAFLTALFPMAKDRDQENVATILTQVETVVQNLPFTPIPVDNVLDVETEKMEDASSEEAHLLIVEEDTARSAEEDTPQSSLSMIGPDGPRIALSLVIPMSRKFLLNTARKKLTPTHQLVFAVVFCLIAIAMGMEVLLFPFSSPNASKSLKATPHSYITVIVHSPTQTSVTATIVPAKSASASVSSIAISSKSTALTQKVIPTQKVALTQKVVPTQKVIPTQEVVPTQDVVPTQVTSPNLIPATPIQVSLSSFFNNEGIGRTPSGANFDGSGYSYPGDQLPSGGLVTVNGVSYQFPASGSGTKDNVIAVGQVIPLPPGHYQQVCLLMAASWGPATGTVTIVYDDGSRSTISLTVLDWLASSTNSLQTSYRYSPGGIDQNRAYIYSVPVALDFTRTATALILPGQLSGPYQQNAHVHVFAMTVLP